MLDDPNLSLTPGEIIKNLRLVLGEIAEQLQRSGEDYVLLRKLSSGSFAQLLWRLSGPEDALSEDARSRVGARSLLGRVVREDLQEEWPVDFCHRSMREYFVAVRLCEAVEAGVEAGTKFFQEVPLNHEILEFAAERWRKFKCGSVKENLLALVNRAVPSKQPVRFGGCALTLLYRIEPRLPRDFSWKGKVFDGADLENADPWLRSGREWIFFVRGEDETLSRSGRFRIKDSLDGVRAQQELLVFTEKDKEDDIRVVVVDLKRQGKLCSIPTNTTRHCAALGTDAVVWSDAQVGFRVKSLPVGERQNDLILPFKEPSCLDVFRIREGVYLVGGGTADGHLHVWKVNLQNGARNQDKVLEALTHEGAVTAVAFVDDARLSSGGEDCAIVVSRWTQGGSISERRLQLKLRCRGLKIAGLKSSVEHALLAKLIQEAENQGLA